MASALTYSSLLTDLQSYFERSDSPFIDQLPRFVMMAENRISAEAKPLGFLRTVDSTLNGNTLVKPARWRRTKSMSIVVGGQRKFLKDREFEYCVSYWPDDAATAAPEFYADMDYEHFFIAPTPNAAYPLRMQYYERPVPLDETNQTNWLTQYAPQVLLYACLMEAAPWLKVSERLPEFQSLYQAALGAITKEDSERLIDGSAFVKVQ